MAISATTANSTGPKRTIRRDDRGASLERLDQRAREAFVARGRRLPRGRLAFGTPGHRIADIGPEATGRRLDFLMQELNREANTLGSKSVDTETTRASVDLKVLIEQMREQIQNVE